MRELRASCQGVEAGWVTGNKDHSKRHYRCNRGKTERGGQPRARTVRPLSDRVHASRPRTTRCRTGCGPKGPRTRRNTARLLAGSSGSWHLPWRMEDHVKFSPRRSPVARAVRVLEFYVPSFGAAMLSGAPSADDACCSATPLHGSGLSSGAPVAAATSAGVMRAHFGARYTWPRRCCAGCRTAAADHLLLETMGCAAVGRSFVMSSNSTEAWDAQEWVVTELQHHPCRLFHPYPLCHCATLHTHRARFFS